MTLLSFDNHNFTDGDFVEYEFFDTAVVGLSTTTRYKVLTVDNKSFRLANAGVGGTNLTDYTRRKHVALDSVGVGSHIFKYPAIEVTINAVTTQQTTGQFTATLLSVVLLLMHICMKRVLIMDQKHLILRKCPNLQLPVDLVLL